jgi:retinol dehydrogenase 12
MNVPKDLLTAQNYDLQFGTNVIGHYFLSKLLIPLMEATAATLPPTDPVRLIELTSDGHLSNANKGVELINYDSIIPGKTRDGTGSMQLYFQSKSGNVLVSSARARLFSGKNMISITVHPGMSPQDDLKLRYCF